LAKKDDKGAGPTVKMQNAWLAERKAVRAELIEVAGEKFDIRIIGKDVLAPVDREAPGETRPDVRLHESPRFAAPDGADRSGEVARIAQLAGLNDIHTDVREDEKGKGPARWLRTITGEIDPSTP